MSNVFKKLCRIAGEAVVKYQLIADGDRILVGVSGGSRFLRSFSVIECRKESNYVGY